MNQNYYLILRSEIGKTRIKMSNSNVKVICATDEHMKYAERICQLMYESALQRGTGIAKRSPEYVADKMRSGKAVVALDGDACVGFSYIESWGHGDYVATSGLIVDPDYRHQGLASRIKQKTFELARSRFPFAKIFSITTSLPVMKLNTHFGYLPVTFAELTTDDEFWEGCKGCVNYDILQRNGRKRCICTAMLYDPKLKVKGKSRLKPFAMYMANKVKNIFSLK